MPERARREAADHDDDSYPAQRNSGTKEDIANAARFLASDEAAYITDHVLDVTSGMHMN